MKIGTVFKWNNFELRKHGEIKPRWFIYLGQTDYGNEPIIAYITTTTQLFHYEQNGNRKNHNFIKFKVISHKIKSNYYQKLI